MTYTGKAVCPYCGKTISTLIPKGGDGSGSVYRRHLASPGGVPCRGSRQDVRSEAYLDSLAVAPFVKRGIPAQRA